MLQLARTMCGLVLVVTAAPAWSQPADRWGPLRPLLGSWEGTTSGQPGRGTVRRDYQLVLGDRFIEVQNTSTYPPQDKNPKGEVHQDRGFISVDTARKLFVLRQFHVEGFVNTYTAAPEGPPIVFTSEAIENIPTGWRARETWRLEPGGELVEVFELAEPGKEFTTYSETRLRRVAK
jgi:THAP4-like, heme-binding beta-barrel domain